MSQGHEPGLRGKLLYAGALDGEARALLVAANIAGAASLTASADAGVSKQAIRDGVVDFMVTSLDEALRILKNEIRKRNAVAVCVAMEAEAAETDFARQMLERGVRPDITWPVEPFPPEANQALLAWSVASEGTHWLPRLDALAIQCLDSGSSRNAVTARRWLQLAPRYLGRMAKGLRLLRCDEETAARFCEEIRQRVERGEIGVSVALGQGRNGKMEWSSFAATSR